MATWYRVYASGRIERVEVEGATDNYVYINRMRHRKETERHSIHPTFGRAKAWLVETAEAGVASAEVQLCNARAYLAECEAITEADVR